MCVGGVERSRSGVARASIRAILIPSNGAFACQASFLTFGIFERAS